jgi:putative oxidoreductase
LKGEFPMLNLLIESNSVMSNSAILLVRVAIGVCFVIHGLGKLGLVGTGNMKGFSSWLASLGVPFPEVQARVAMLSEIVGGLLMAVGLFTRVGLLLCFATMIVATTLGHRGAGYLITNTPPGCEYALNLAIICVGLFLLGPGAYSLDAVWFSAVQ